MESNHDLSQAALNCRRAAKEIGRLRMALTPALFVRYGIVHHGTLADLDSMTL